MPPVLSPSQTRKAPVSNADRPVKRTRSVSTSTKVSHHLVTENHSRSPEGAGLSSIPDELLLEIMEYLCDDKDALAKLCRTSKRCRNIAREVLYRAINVRMNKKAALAVARWPWLAKNVRVLFCYFTSLIGIEYDREAYVRILETACNARVVILVVGRTNTNELANTQSWLDLFNKAVDRPMDSLNQFSQLRHLCINVRHREIPFFLPVEGLSGLFRLPTLEILDLRNIHQTTPFKNWMIPTSTSPINTLILQNAAMDITAVVQMVISINNLQNFEYEYSTREWEPFGEEDNPLSYWPAHSWKLLGDAIKQHRRCLKSLVISETSDKQVIDSIYPDGRNLGLLGSFFEFPQLEEMNIPIEALVGSKVGESDFSLYLPEQLSRFTTYVDSTDPDFITSIASVLLSLQHRLKVLGVFFEEMGLDELRKSPRLYECLRQLHDSGVRLGSLTTLLSQSNTPRI